jgi:hypothetical protein
LAEKRGADLFVIDSTGEKSLSSVRLASGIPFLERNDEHWVRLFSGKFDVRSFPLPEVEGVEQQTLYHLQVKKKK